MDLSEKDKNLLANIYSATILNPQNEPTSKYASIASLPVFISLILVTIFASSTASSHQLPLYSLPTTSISHFDQNAQTENYFDDTIQLSILQQTPPLSTYEQNKFQRSYRSVRARPSGQENILIQPSRVIDSPMLHKSNDYDYLETNLNLYTPIFHFDLLTPDTIRLNRKYERDTYSSSSNSPQLDSLFDQVEQGSGNWFNQLSDGSPDVPNEMSNFNSNFSNELTESQSSIRLDGEQATSFEDSRSKSVVGQDFNRPPLLNRRFPKLSVIAGKFWRHFIPYDTFVDEEGDLRNLKSTIMIKKLRGSDKKIAQQDSSTQPLVVGDYFSWIQYDQSTKLLYGFPVEKDIGSHQLILLVTDRQGASSEELIEINVKQHQSSRAFSHLFILNEVYWDLQSFPSMVDALGEFIKRITTKVYFDKPFDNLVVQYYEVEDDKSNDHVGYVSGDTPSKRKRSSFTMGWSNSSVPIYPCNTTEIELLFKPLVDDQNIRSRLLADDNRTAMFNPSKELLRVVGPEFQPSHASTRVSGACESRVISAGQNDRMLDGSVLKVAVKNRIGKLDWKLGEMIEYTIPPDTFETSSGIKTRDMHLTLHTIDGHLLGEDPRYNFLDFDKESQTLYGLPYDFLNHTGQKEVQLTAIDPKTGKKAREVFVLNIEPFDLTSINNRAFKISLYVVIRTIEFGPRDRIRLGQRMIQAVKNGTTSRTFQSQPEFIVTDIQKFAAAPSQSSTYSNQNEIIRIIDDRKNSRYHDSYDVNSRLSSQESYIYRFTWTDTTIGHRGDCPVEVIQENILYALEQRMMDLDIPFTEDPSKNGSTRFFDRLHYYFEPDYDLKHLRFEPTGSCTNELKLHDVGDSDLADIIDRASELQAEQSVELWTSSDSTLTTVTPLLDNNEDEYWSIVVLIILVVALIFVIIMFFMGMHTYKMNQDKRFELQVRLAQARQNSMYLSSMILSNQAVDETLRGRLIASSPAKQAYSLSDEDRNSRKPVILDAERDYLNNSSIGKLTAVQLDGHSVHTLPLKPTTTFTLDSIAGTLQPMMGTIGHSSSVMTSLDDRRSMTLHRRPSYQRITSQQASLYNLNQQVVPMLAPMPVLMPSQAAFYQNGQVPVIGHLPMEPNFFSLNRQNHLLYRPTLPVSLESQNLEQSSLTRDNVSIELRCKQDGINGPSGRTISGSDHSFNKTCSSSSPSVTGHSVISNPNFARNEADPRYGL